MVVYLLLQDIAHSQHNELSKTVTLDLHAWLMSERETWVILYSIMKERIEDGTDFQG